MMNPTSEATTNPTARLLKTLLKFSLGAAAVLWIAYLFRKPRGQGSKRLPPTEGR